MSHEAVLGIFTKAPVPGKVKTRTRSLLSPEEAASLHKALVLDTLEMTRSLSVRRVLFVAGGLDDAFLQQVSREEGVEIRAQIGEDLGTRMRNAFEESGVRGKKRVCLIGTDSPHLPQEYIKSAFLQLERHEVVVGPAADSGYYLIGLCGVVPPIFEGIAWGTPEVLPRTLRRLTEKEYSYALLPFWYDIDEPRDLELLRAHLPVLLRESPGCCARTGKFLQTIFPPSSDT